MPTKNFTPEDPRIPAVAIIAGLAVLFGIGIFSFGFWLAWRPLGFIMGGMAVITLGVLLGRRAQRVSRRQA